MPSSRRGETLPSAVKVRKVRKLPHPPQKISKNYCNLHKVQYTKAVNNIYAE